jgi:hypothetical protein
MFAREGDRRLTLRRDRNGGRPGAHPSGWDVYARREELSPTYVRAQLVEGGVATKSGTRKRVAPWMPGSEGIRPGFVLVDCSPV